MKKLILFLLFIVFTSSTCEKKIENTINQHTMFENTDTITRNQLDSLFLADTISFDIENDWIKSSVLDEDKKKFLYKYIFIKEYTDSTGMIYTLSNYDTLYIITKRIIK